MSVTHENPIHILSLHGQILSPTQKDLFHQAHIIAGGKALLEQWAKYMDSARQELRPLGAQLNETLEELIAAQAQGQRVLILADGDALYFGVGATLSQRLPAEKLHIHAGISIMQRLCALAAVPWHDVHHVSLHGRDEATRWQALYGALFHRKTVCVLTDATTPPQRIAAQLVERGAQDVAVYALSRFGQTEGQEDQREQQEQGEQREQGETFHHAPLEDVAKGMALHALPHPYTLLLRPQRPSKTNRPQEAQQKRLHLGLASADLAHENGLITKAPVRAAALSLLNIEPTHTLWDVGAGSGAVALEACTLAHQGRVIALEQSPTRVAHIHKNRQNFGALILDIVHGKAPEALQNLPRPHGIFVGGGLSGANNHAILTTLCDKLHAGGRLVMSAVLLATVHNIQEFFKNKGWPVHILQIQTQESTPLAHDVRLVAHNPVFLLWITKP